MTGPQRADLARRAREEVATLIRRVVRDAGGEFAIRPLSPDSSLTVSVPDPMMALQVARSAELSARSAARTHAEEARAAGRSWAEIGDALGLAGTDGQTPDEAAFSYASGPQDSAWNRTYGPSVTWRCPACQGSIRDRGPCSGPRDDEAGHDSDCSRLAAAVTAWETSFADEED